MASYSSWLFRTTPDYAGLLPDYAGLLPGYFRATPVGSAGHRGSRYPPQGPAWASGKLPTRLPVSPVPVQFTSTFAGLGRDSLIYNGGGPPFAGLWPALSGHQILTRIHFNSYPVRDLCYNFQIHPNTFINPHYNTYKCHIQQYIHNSGNSVYLNNQHV